MDREELIDAFIEADKDIDYGMWKSSYYAYELFDQYGAYSHDTLSILKEQRKLKPDAIYNRKYAWEELCKFFQAQGEPRTFPDLKASHFYRLHRLRHTTPIADNVAAGYLETAETCRWTGDELVEVVQSLHDRDEEKTFYNALARWKRKGSSLFSDSEKLGKLGLPDYLMKSLHTCIKEIEKWLEEKQHE